MTITSLSTRSILHSLPCVGSYFPLFREIARANCNQSTFALDTKDLPVQFSDEEITTLKNCGLTEQNGDLKLGQVSCSAIACAFIHQVSQRGNSLHNLQLNTILKKGILAYIAQTKITLENLKKRTQEIKEGAFSQGSDDIAIASILENFKPQRQNFYLQTLDVPNLPPFKESLMIKKLPDRNKIFSTNLKGTQEIFIYQELIDNFLSTHTDSLREIGDRAYGLLTLSPGTYAMVYEKSSSDYVVYFFDSHGDPGDIANPATVKKFHTSSDFIKFLSEFHPYNDVYDNVQDGEVRNTDLNQIGFCALEPVAHLGGSTDSDSERISGVDKFSNSVSPQYFFSSSSHGNTSAFVAKKILPAMGLLILMCSINIGLKRWSFTYFSKASLITTHTHFYSRMAGIISALILMNRADWKKYTDLIKTARSAIFA